MEQVRVALDFLYIDWGTLYWKELYQINNFQWTYGKTPFSHIQVPVIVGITYLISLFSLQSYMKERKPFVLKVPTFVHNLMLTSISVVMFLGTAYGARTKYLSQGFWSGLVCEQEALPIKGPLFYWSYVFYLSKFYELIDSFLLVLKKKPLIFLHVFHHFVMPFVCWAGLEGKWCMALWTSAFWNSLVHILMYYYYAVSTIGYSPWWKKHLTGLQIYQFVSGVFYTAIYFYYYFKDLTISLSFTNSSTINYSDDTNINGESSVKLFPLSVSFNRGCTGEFWAVTFMFAVNCSFLFLFSKFYVEQYLVRSKQKREKKEE